MFTGNFPGAPKFPIFLLDFSMNFYLNRIRLSFLPLVLLNRRNSLYAGFFCLLKMCRCNEPRIINIHLNLVVNDFDLFDDLETIFAFVTRG